MPLPKRATCGDCGVHEGQIHQDGCDMERCAFCGHQRISCDCALRHFYPNMKGLGELFANGVPDLAGPRMWEQMGIPQHVYEKGFDAAQEAEWSAIEAAKGRVPFILYPNICRRCGELWPDMFKVPDELWERYVQLSERHEMLCAGCYSQVKGYIEA